MDKEEVWLNCGRYPLADPDPGILEAFFETSTLRDRAFSHNLAHISGKTDRIFMIF